MAPHGASLSFLEWEVARDVMRGSLALIGKRRVSGCRCKDVTGEAERQTFLRDPVSDDWSQLFIHGGGEKGGHAVSSHWIDDTDVGIATRGWDIFLTREGGGREGGRSERQRGEARRGGGGYRVESDERSPFSRNIFFLPKDEVALDHLLYPRLRPHVPEAWEEQSRAEGEGRREEVKWEANRFKTWLKNSSSLWMLIISHLFCLLASFRAFKWWDEIRGERETERPLGRGQGTWSWQEVWTFERVYFVLLREGRLRRVRGKEREERLTCTPIIWTKDWRPFR
jgi:hypothetical protein